MPLTIHQLIAAAASLAVAGMAVILRVRSSRDRRRIREDLQSRHCQLIAAQWSAKHTRWLRARGYHVEFVDAEGDPGQTTCAISRRAIAWEDEIAFSGNCPIVTLPASNLPTYGQNWRG